MRICSRWAPHSDKGLFKELQNRTICYFCRGLLRKYILLLQRRSRARRSPSATPSLSHASRRWRERDECVATSLTHTHSHARARQRVPTLVATKHRPCLVTSLQVGPHSVVHDFDVDIDDNVVSCARFCIDDDDDVDDVD